MHKEFKEKEFFATTSLVTIIMFAFINIINIDGLIAQKYKPTVNGEIDYYYLTNLSTDAKNVWKESIEDTEKVVTQLEGLNEISPEDNRKLYWAGSTIMQLDLKIGDVIDKYGTFEQIKSWHKNDADPPADTRNIRKWQAFNFSEYSAYKEVIDNITYFEENIFTLSGRIKKLESKVNEKVRQNTPLDRSTNPPLLR
ncbi:DUF4173 domain-containing protein [Candidatus Daviesbacteria bacterium]|nr:DUF4173 domain-containing protein [Candidatus Daviesbacteria bacterium]